MGWKRLMIFLLAVFLLAGGGRAIERMAGHGQGTGTTAVVQGLSQVSQSAQLVKPTLYNPAVPHDVSIPKDALRLRIIANSDSAKDQELKREVRDAIVVQVATLLQHAKTEPEAQKIVSAHLQQLQSLAQTVVRKHGFSYDVKANVGTVPFPTKVYGNRVYPAGNYKALRLILGKGQGQNWWCVLFPPLCFIDIADGDAVPNTGGFPDLPPLETLTVKNLQGQPTKVQVRLATVDYGEELLKAMKNWF